MQSAWSQEDSAIGVLTLRHEQRSAFRQYCGRSREPGYSKIQTRLIGLAVKD
jgi:hypothetical protein